MLAQPRQNFGVTVAELEGRAPRNAEGVRLRFVHEKSKRTELGLETFFRASQIVLRSLEMRPSL